MSFAFGVGATAFVLYRDSAAPSEPGQDATVDEPGFGDADELDQTVFERDDGESSQSIREALELFEVAAAVSDWADLERMIVQRANITMSTRRDSELAVLVLRSIDLNPERALELFYEIPLESELLATAYLAWAQTDLDSALARLSVDPDQSFRRRVAIEIFEGTGQALHLLRQFSEIVDDRNRDGFISDGLIAASLSQPREALESSLTIEDPLVRDQTVRRIAENWAEEDFASAIRHVAELSDDSAPLRNAFHVGVVRGLALREPGRALEYISSAEGQRLFSLRCSCTNEILSLIAGQDPEGLLVAAGRVPPEIADAWRYAAVRSLVDQDLNFALDHVSTVQNLAERAAWVEAITTTFARNDPVAAFSWISDGSEQEARRMLSAMARTNPRTAIDLALSHPEYASIIDGWLTPQGIWSLTTSELSGLADRLSSADSQAPATLAKLVEAWSQVDPDAAADWVFRRTEVLGPDIAARIVAGLDYDLDTLISRLDSAAPATRRELVIAIASDYIQSDTASALRWLQGLRGEPEYDEWISEAARRAGSWTSLDDPARTARMLETATHPDPEVTSAVAERWAHADPGSAADWSVGLTNSESRSAATRASLGVWMAEDAESAKRWVLSIPKGDIKDVALRTVLVSSVELPRFDHRSLFSEFATQSARAEALDDVAMAFGVSAKASGVDIAQLIDDRIADDRIAASVLERVAALGLD